MCLERDWDKHKLELREVITSKSHRFWSICLLPLDKFATFLNCSFLFFIILFPQNFTGGIPLTGKFRGDMSTPMGECIVMFIRLFFQNLRFGIHIVPALISLEK